jgi:hypothetical protein
MSTKKVGEGFIIPISKKESGSVVPWFRGSVVPWFRGSKVFDPEKPKKKPKKKNEKKNKNRKETDAPPSTSSPHGLTQPNFFLCVYTEYRNNIKFYFILFFIFIKNEKSVGKL